jgi:hypothetical protein
MPAEALADDDPIYGAFEQNALVFHEGSRLMADDRPVTREDFFREVDKIWRKVEAQDGVLERQREALERNRENREKALAELSQEVSSLRTRIQLYATIAGGALATILTAVQLWKSLVG